MYLRHIRPALHGLTHERDRFLVVPLLSPNDPQQVKRVEVVASCLQNGFASRGRLSQLAVLIEPDCFGEQLSDGSRGSALRGWLLGGCFSIRGRTPFWRPVCARFSLFLLSAHKAYDAPTDLSQILPAWTGCPVNKRTILRGPPPNQRNCGRGQGSGVAPSIIARARGMGSPGEWSRVSNYRNAGGGRLG